MKSSKAVAVVFLIALGACTTSPASTPPPPKPAVPGATGYMAAEFKQLNAAIKLCTSKHGYDPASSQRLPRYHVSSNELKARACIYDAVQRIMVPASKNAALYTNLIAQDRALTKAVMQRRLTRSQRRARIQKLVAGIRDAESQIGAASEAAKRARNQELGRQAVQFMFSMR
jgi:hypothetical protein